MSQDPEEAVGLAPADRTFIWYLSLIGFFAIFSTTISKNPVLPLFVHSLGGSETLIGLVSAVSPLAGILFSFPIGVLSDHLGRRRLLVVSGFVFLLAPLLYLIVSDPFLLIPVRFFHGTATAILGPVISAIIATRYPSAKGEMLGIYSSASLVGRTLAPLAGGIILSFFLFAPGLVPYHMVYAAAAIAAVPVFVLILLYKEERPLVPGLPGLSVFRESFAAFFQSRSLRAAAAADMATYFVLGAIETFLPLYLVQRGYGAWEVGIVFTVQVLMVALTKPSFGRIADRIDKRIQIGAGLLITGGSVALIPFISGIAMMIAVSAGVGFGLSLSTIATSAFVADVARKEQIGASMGALSSIMDIGHAGGPLLTGIIIAATGYTTGLVAGFAICLGATAFLVLSTREPGGATA